MTGHHPWSEIKRKRATEPISAPKTWKSGTVAVLAAAVAAISLSVGVIIGAQGRQDIDVDGHEGEVLIDSDGDGDFEWIPEGKLHEMRGHS